MVSPLEEAVWLGEEKISQLLLENGAAKGNMWWYGALHGAIAWKMFALMRVLIKKGAPVDSVYSGVTPLCAALTCGKKRRGDVRLVRLLLKAKADLAKKLQGQDLQIRPVNLHIWKLPENTAMKIAFV